MSEPLPGNLHMYQLDGVRGILLEKAAETCGRWGVTTIAALYDENMRLRVRLAALEATS